MNILGDFKISILKTPTNKYIYVGNVPYELCNKIERRSICGAEYVSKVFNTKREAEIFAISYGFEL